MRAILHSHANHAIKDLRRYLAAHQRRRLAELADGDPKRVAINRLDRAQPVEHTVALGGDQALSQLGGEKWERDRFNHHYSLLLLIPIEVPDCLKQLSRYWPLVALQPQSGQAIAYSPPTTRIKTKNREPRTDLRHLVLGSRFLVL